MSKQATALEGDTDKPSLVSTPDSSEKDRRRHICMTECIRISEHLERLRQSWGAGHFSLIIIQPATVAAFALLENLQDRPEYQAAFYELCIVLRAASRRFRVCKGVLRLQEKTSKENGIVVPDGVASCLPPLNTLTLWSWMAWRGGSTIWGWTTWSRSGMIWILMRHLEMSSASLLGRRVAAFCE